MTVTVWPLGIGAMFPIAPGFERKYSAKPRLVVPASQVTASEDLPVGALSEPFPLNDYQQHEISVHFNLYHTMLTYINMVL